jgi:hypothetical protein
MERTSNQPTFLDNATSDLGGLRTAEFFHKCNDLIPRNELAEPLKDMCKNTTDKGGASNYPLVMMIKCMMLQKWFNLSDPMLEEMLVRAFPCCPQKRCSKTSPYIPMSAVASQHIPHGYPLNSSSQPVAHVYRQLPEASFAPQAPPPQSVSCLRRLWANRKGCRSFDPDILHIYGRNSPILGH